MDSACNLPPSILIPFGDRSWTNRNKLADFPRLFSLKAKNGHPIYCRSSPLLLSLTDTQRSLPKHSHTSFPSVTTAIPRKGEAGGEEERREGLYHLCTLGRSLVLVHIKCSFSQVASFQRSKEEGALLWGQLLLSAWHVSCYRPTMLRGCQICWAFRSMQRAEQLLQ